MALTESAYSNFKTMSQYANQLAYLKKQYEAGNTAWAAEQASKLRWQAVLNGFDLKVLEREAVIKLGRDPKAIDWDQFEKTTNAPFVAAVTLANLKKEYMSGSIGADVAHEEAQKVRLNAAYNGIDLDLLELRATQYVDPNKKEPNPDDVLPLSGPDIKEAKYAAELLKNAEYWKRIDEDPNLTPGQKEWYKNQVHQESQNFRADALRDGLNLWEIEKLFTPFVTGRPWGKEDYEIARKYIDPLYKAAGKDPAGVQLPNFTTGGTQNNYAYKKPIVKRTTFGETYSGADMVVFFAFPGHKPIEVGVATTVSITSYREKKQFRAIGRISPRGITKGPRTISGKLIFTVIKEHFVETLKSTIPYLKDYSALKMDELPSFDILISMGNEYGGAATLVINGVTTVDEQKTMSIEELFTENIFTYLARDYQPLREIQKSKWDIYDPQEWFSYKFREAGSELIGKFQIDDLLLSENAKEFAKALPATGLGEEWAKLSAQDIAAAYYSQLPNEEDARLAAAAEATVHARKIFVQVFSKKTNELVTAGKLSLKFDNNGYNDPTRPWENGDPDGYMSGFNADDGGFDWSLAKAKGGRYYGLLVHTDNPLPAGAGFKITYSGAKGVPGYPSFKAATMTAKSADGEFTYVKVMVDEVADTNLYFLKSAPGDQNFKLDNFFESYRKWDEMPDLEKLTQNDYYKHIQKSTGGWEWVECEVMRGSEMAEGIPVSFAWRIYWNFFVAGNEQWEKRDAIANESSKPAVKYFEGTELKTIKTNSYGQVSIRVRDLVYWLGTDKKKKTFDDLPSSAVVKIFANISNGQYIQWMLRKVDKLSDL